jgi:hypothetical protein
MMMIVLALALIPMIQIVIDDAKAGFDLVPSEVM